MRGDGATNAGAGMSNANNVLNGSDRLNANQVVIFFTDGVPTTQSNFSESVANTAVENAHAIKNRGGMVYSIGIFNGADPSQTEPDWNPSETRQANVFMNAVSSNYPNSSAWDNLGDRAQGDPDYYKATSDASELTTIFDEIFDETTSNIGSGSPIEEVTTGGANNTPTSLVRTWKSPVRVLARTRCRLPTETSSSRAIRATRQGTRPTTRPSTPITSVERSKVTRFTTRQISLTSPLW